MGWLRELMSDVGQPSFEALARTALAHSHWPQEIQPKSRSLGTILGRLDRDLELEWLAERPAIQQVLSDILRCPLAEIRDHLAARTEVAASATDRLRLSDLRTGRSLELSRVSLPPSIPAFVSVPRSWDKVLWKAPSGSGKTLAGKWLAARGLAEVVTITGDGELSSLPPGSSPLYVDCLVAVTEPILANLALRRSVCVATDRVADWARAQSPCGETTLAGWSLCEQPSILETLETTVDWTSLLLPASSGVRPAEVALLLRRMAEDWGVIETLADVIGVLGIVDELGVSRIAQTDQKSLIALLLKRRLTEHLDRRDPKASGLRRLLPEVLVEMAKLTLSEAGRSLLEPRSFEEWMQAIPLEHRRSTDLDWLRVQLGAPEVSLHARDLERAERRLPPGAHRILSALREAELLVPVGGELHALRPHFLVRLVDRLGRQALVHGSPTEWGEALLSPIHRPVLMLALAERTKRDPAGVVEDVLELLDEQSPALVTALESVFVVVGLGILGGLEVPTQTLMALVEEQAALATQTRAGLPQRRIACLPPATTADTAGTYLLCILAIGEGLPEALRAKHRSRLSMETAEEETRSYLVLDEIASLVPGALDTQAPWLPGALALLDRLRHQSGVVGRDGHPHPLLSVGVVLDEIEHGVLESPSLTEMVREPWAMKLLSVARAKRGLPEETVVAALWECLATDPLPDHAAARILGDSSLPMWEHATADPVVGWLVMPESAPCPVRPELLPVAVWKALLDKVGGLGSLEPGLLRWLPTSLAEALIGFAGHLAPSHLELLWERWPHACIARIEAMRATEPSTAHDWLLAAPAVHDQSLVTASTESQWIRGAHPFCEAVRQRLHGAIARRCPGWRLAYEAFCELEADLRRAP
jgi:hypothetical protein